MLHGGNLRPVLGDVDCPGGFFEGVTELVFPADCDRNLHGNASGLADWV